MRNEKDVKKRVKKIFYEGEKRPSYKNYIMILAVFVIISIGGYFVVTNTDTLSLEDSNDVIESSSEVNNAISDMENMLANASETLGDIGNSI